MDGRLEGGFDGGAYLVDGTVRRVAGAWTPAVSALLGHLCDRGFAVLSGALWRQGRPWRDGLIIGHNDAAPYNAVWNRRGLVGFVDWDMAGPVTVEEDLAWVAFSWVPLHARARTAGDSARGCRSG